MGSDGSISHGLFRVPGYVAALASGKVRGNAQPKLTTVTPSLLRCDGDNSFAPLAHRRRCITDTSTYMCVSACAQAFLYVNVGVRVLSTLQHTAKHSLGPLETTAKASGIAALCNTLQNTETHCNILQHSATHCSTLQHIATRSLGLLETAAKTSGIAALCNTLQYTETHSNTLQHTATYCNTLQHTATHCNTLQHAV